MQLEHILHSLGIRWEPKRQAWLDGSDVASRSTVLLRLIACGYPVVVVGYAQLTADLTALEVPADAVS